MILVTPTTCSNFRLHKCLGNQVLAHPGGITNLKLNALEDSQSVHKLGAICSWSQTELEFFVQIDDIMIRHLIIKIHTSSRGLKVIIMVCHCCHMMTLILSYDHHVGRMMKIYTTCNLCVYVAKWTLTRDSWCDAHNNCKLSYIASTNDATSQRFIYLKVRRHFHFCCIR